MIAMIFAIGMSFATETVESDPNQDYILVSGAFMPIGTEVQCGTPSSTCQARFQENGQIHEIYDAPNLNSKKIGDGTIKRVGW